MGVCDQRAFRRRFALAFCSIRLRRRSLSIIASLSEDADQIGRQLEVDEMPEDAGLIAKGRRLVPEHFTGQPVLAAVLERHNVHRISLETTPP